MRGLHALALLIVFFLTTACTIPGTGGRVTARPDAPYRVVSKLKTAIKAPPGILYTRHTVPLVDGPRLHEIEAFNPITFGSKVGSSTANSIGLPPLPFPGLTTGIELFSWGDASEEAAAKSAGIQEVDYTDYRFEVYLAIFRRVTVVAYGD